MRTTAGDSGKGRRIMVLLPDGRAKIRAEGFAKGYAEGKAESERELADWANWYVRWKDCQDKGEPFDEPPPDGYCNRMNGSDGGSE